MLPVVAIDGPVGVGKSTTAKRVADELGFRHLDTGAMYRAVAWSVMQLPEAEHSNFAAIANIARTMPLSLASNGQVFAGDQEISSEIRDESVSQFVTRVADNMDVRHALVEQQQRLGMEQPSVLEGRDIGTVVFPNAACKIYLDASPKVRVERRAAQLRAMGKRAVSAQIHAALLERDARDRAREWGALKLAEDATLIDTTHYDEDTVVRLICALVRENPIFRELVAVAP
ncbi:(d)CMP kinase [soil metagenome]